MKKFASAIEGSSMHKPITAIMVFLILVFITKSQATQLDCVVAAETWYAAWESESGLDDLGVKLSYDIKPTVIYGYSASVCYSRDSLLGGIFVSYLTSEMEKDYEQQTNEDTALAYQELKAQVAGRIYGVGYLTMKVMKGEFDGTLRLKGGKGFFDTMQPDHRLASEWLKLDTVLLLNPDGEDAPAMVGLGYRYFCYNKPQAIVTFYGDEEDTGTYMGMGVTPIELISGKIVEAKIEGHLLLLGIWDTTVLGMDANSNWFFDFLFYVGSANISADGYSSKGRIALGWEGSLGLKHTWHWSEHTRLTVRIGARVLQHKTAYAERTGMDENRSIYTGAYIEELFYGPFMDVTASF